MNTPSSKPSPPGAKRRKDVAIDINTARQMLPLVRSIVSDIVTTRQRLSSLGPEQERLNRIRRSLDWSDRNKRYSIDEEIKGAEKELAGAVNELANLGIALVDAEAGKVAFPTRINGRPAAFSWQFGEDALNFWHYAGEDLRRPIPGEWPGAVTNRPHGQP